MFNNLEKHEEVAARARSLYCKQDDAYGKVVDKIVTYTQDREAYLLIGYKDGSYTQYVSSYLYENEAIEGYCPQSPILPDSPYLWGPFIALGLLSSEDVVAMCREMDEAKERHLEECNKKTYRQLYEAYGGAHPDEIK